MKRILSIQSHVAYGFVGNRAAVFPLQRLGHDAVAVNTVQFSNHTGYGEWAGEVFGPEHIDAVIGGLDKLGALAGCDAVLSGYMGSVEIGKSIQDAVSRVRSQNPSALYCCDPVMGDTDRGFFVRPGLPEFIRDHAVPAADIVTPNQFELEHLVGRPIGSLPDATSAAAAVRRRGPRYVLLTSLTRSDARQDSIEMMVDTAEGCWLAATPRLPFDPLPNGAGDAVAAIFLAKLLETGDPASALAHATGAIYGIFAATAEAGTRELALIQAQEEIVRPSRTFPVEKVR